MARAVIPLMSTSVLWRCSAGSCVKRFYQLLLWCQEEPIS